MKRFILQVAAMACIAMPACKKETVVLNNQPQQLTQEQMLKGFAQTLDECSAYFSTQTTAKKLFSGPVDSENPLDFVGEEHNRRIKRIIAEAPSNPSPEEVYQAYVSSLEVEEPTERAIPGLEDYYHYIDEGKKQLYRVENGRMTINPEAYRSAHFSGLTNEVLIMFFETQASVSDYELRRTLSLNAEHYIAAAAIDAESKAQLLGTLSLFKWSDYFWNREYNGPLNIAVPGPAFWDVLWTKFKGPECDALGATPPGVACWNDVIDGSSAISALFLNNSFL